MPFMHYISESLHSEKGHDFGFLNYYSSDDSSRRTG